MIICPRSCAIIGVILSDGMRWMGERLDRNLSPLIICTSLTYFLTEVFFLADK